VNEAVPTPLPCPFCGCENVVVDPDIESVTCNGCTATGPSMLTTEHESEDAMAVAVIDAWNTRR